MNIKFKAACIIAITLINLWACSALIWHLMKGAGALGLYGLPAAAIMFISNIVIALMAIESLESRQEIKKLKEKLFAIRVKQSMDNAMKRL